MKYASYGLRGLLTIVFLMAGGAKLASTPDMIAAFEAVGFGQWFRYLTGIIEVGSAILLWIPGLQVIAALLLGGTMVGAVLAHLLILGPSAVPAVILGLICCGIIYLHKEQLPQKIQDLLPKFG